MRNLLAVVLAALSLASPASAFDPPIGCCLPIERRIGTRPPEPTDRPAVPSPPPPSERPAVPRIPVER